MQRHVQFADKFLIRMMTQVIGQQHLEGQQHHHQHHHHHHMVHLETVIAIMDHHHLAFGCLTKQGHKTLYSEWEDCVHYILT